MKGINCCGDCAFYDWKRHKCSKTKVELQGGESFYADCPLPEAIDFPCKIGQQLYIVVEGEEPFVDVGMVFALGIDENHKKWVSVRYECGLKMYHPAETMGRNVFFTGERAEKALKELKQ